MEERKQEFFKNCEYITKAPACIFLEGNRFSKRAKVLPIPLYAYAGIERGNFKKYLYEEEIGIRIYYKWEYSDQLDNHVLSMIPLEEKKLIINNTPISSNKKDRKLFYQLFFKVVFEMPKQSLGKPEDYFKIKVWTEIPPNRGLNEGAAIAVAVALLLKREYDCDTQEEKKGCMAQLNMLRENLQEEIVLSSFFIALWTTALILDFFSNGAAVFASLLGSIKELEVIDYECVVYDELKDFFMPIPISKKTRLNKIIRFCEYFRKCEDFYMYNFKAISLFKWSFLKVSFKEKEKLAIALFRGCPTSIHGNDFMRFVNKKKLDLEDLGIKRDDHLKYYIISPSAFAILGIPFNIALCLKNPEIYVFEKEFTPFSYSAVYSSRRMGWGTEGAKFLEPEEYKLPAPPKGGVIIEKPEVGKAEIPKEIEVNFSKDDNYIKFDGKETEITGGRIFLLLDELINRKVLHWSWGIVVFDGWENEVPDDPAGQFRVEKDRFNSKFGFDLIECVPQEKKEKKKRRWTLIKGVVIKSSIQESDFLCNEAAKQENPLKKLELLDKALFRYPYSLKAIKLLVNLLQENPLLVNQEKESTEKLLLSICEVLVKRRNKLKGATDRIEEEGKNKGWPGDWGEVIPYFHIMHRELSEVEAYLKIAEKFLEKKEVVPREDELNIICEEWKILERLAKSEQSKEESQHYKEQLFNQHLKRPLIKEILNKISSKINFKIREELRLRKFEPEDIAQEVQIFYSGLIKKGYLSKMNFKNIEELKGNLIKGLSLKIRDEIIKGKNKDIFTDSNLKRIREVWKIKKELRQKWEREPRDEDVLKKLGPQWDSEKLKEVKEMIKELYKGEEDIDMEKYLKFFEEAKAYEKNREGIELFFES